MSATADLYNYRQSFMSDRKKDWVGKALKWSAAGVTFTLIGKDLNGNVVFKETVDATLDTTAQMLETIIGASGATSAIIFDGGTLDAALIAAGDGVTVASGFEALASLVATWIIDDITGGTITLQSAPVTSDVGVFPHTHGAIVDYDLGAVTDGDKIGFGGDF